MYLDIGHSGRDMQVLRGFYGLCDGLGVGYPLLGQGLGLLVISLSHPDIQVARYSEIWGGIIGGTALAFEQYGVQTMVFQESEDFAEGSIQTHVV